MTLRRALPAILGAMCGAAPSLAKGDFDAAAQLVEVGANTPKNLQRAIALYEGALRVENVPREVTIKAQIDLGRAHLRLGDIQSGEATRLASYNKGRAACREALRLSPRSANALFWDTANLAKIGQLKGLTNSLFMLPELKKNLRQVIQWDPTHLYARQTLARVLHKVPGLMGGSDKKAIRLLQECTQRDPSFTPCKVTLGQLYVDRDEFGKARELFQEVIRASPSSVPNDWRKWDLPEAKRALARIPPP